SRDRLKSRPQEPRANTPGGAASASSPLLLTCRAGTIFTQHLPSGLLNRAPRCPLPGGSRRARRRVLHTACEEGCTPTSVVVPGELQIEALSRHANSQVPNAPPRVEPTMQPQKDRRSLALQAQEAQGGKQET